MPIEQSGHAGGERAQLSRRQRHDLLKLTAAGITSAIFFATPVVLFHNTPASSARAPEGQATAAASTPANVPNVQIVTTDVAAAISIPALQSSRAVSPAVRRSPPPRPRGALASARTRTPLGRRIARLLAGDGSYTVKPFPTVASALR